MSSRPSLLLSARSLEHPSASLPTPQLFLSLYLYTSSASLPTPQLFLPLYLYTSSASLPLSFYSSAYLDVCLHSPHLPPSLPQSFSPSIPALLRPSVRLSLPHSLTPSPSLPGHYKIPNKSLTNYNST